MRWPSASPRPAATCATTSPRASTATKQGRKVFDGIHSHIAGVGRIFFNTPFGQPARTGTQHEDHGFPENEFPFSTAALADPLTGKKGSLFRGDGSDPKLIETNTSTEYWQKGASLLHTDPLGQQDVALPENSPRLHDRRHPAWRPRRRHDRSRTQHQPAQSAQSHAGRARAAGGARRMGGVGQGAAGQPRADAGRRHPGRARQDGLPRRAGRRRGEGHQPGGTAGRLGEPEAGRQGLSHAGLQGRCRRQRSGGRAPARHRRAARHLFRLERIQAAVSCGRTRRPRRQLPALRPRQGGARRPRAIRGRRSPNDTRAAPTTSPRSRPSSRPCRRTG